MESITGGSSIVACSVFPSLCRDPTHPVSTLYNGGGWWLLLNRWSGGWRADPDSKEDGFFDLAARPWVMICIYYTLLGRRKHDLDSCLSHGFDFLNPPILICLSSPIPKCL